MNLTIACKGDYIRLPREESRSYLLAKEEQNLKRTPQMKIFKISFKEVERFHAT